MALATPDIGVPSPSSPPISARFNYDVFLSFHGVDVRHSFVARLYSALRRNGIESFIDEESLVREEEIAVQMRQAIEKSRFAIVVLSENYFSSTWCLEELLMIMESRRKQDLIVIPVYYHINSSDVENQRGRIGDCFEKHEKRFSSSVDKVQRWRDAAREIANVNGFDLTKYGNEAAMIEKIVEYVRDRLYSKLLSDFGHFAGDIRSKVGEVISLLKLDSNETCFVGIWGMGGLGKTTLAQGVYEAVCRQFEASYFLRNIREDSERHSIAYPQRKLLYNLGLVEAKDECFDGALVIRRFLLNKKVLIILDDVSHKSQLENLAGSEEWFGPGSKIIITTRDQSLLTVYRRFEIYEVGALNRDESLKLFCQKAFKENMPKQDYLHLSKEVIEYARGVPLVLTVLGSILCHSTETVWRDILEKYRGRLPKEIFSVLRISFDGLDSEWQMIFLDIACFLNGRTRFEVMKILETCYALPIIYGIEVLIAKSLLSSTQSNSNSRHNAEEGQDMHGRLQKMRSDIFLPTLMYHKLLHETSQESLHMHYFLQEMGRSIVYDESPSDAGRRSRLWNMKDIDHVLKENKGKRKVESIVVDLDHPFEANWHRECFSKMRELRLLDLCRVELAHNLNCLPRALKFLRWDSYALESLPPFDELYELESLQLRRSNIKRLWDGAPELHMLRTIDLSNSDYLRETPDFTGTPNLEKLFLDYCGNLVQVHKSVGQLKKLVELSFRYCTNLVTLPTLLDMNKLEVFMLGECSKLEKLPEFSKNMRMLYFLDVRKTEITEIPLSIINLQNLKYLDLSGCNKLNSIPKLPPNSIIRANKDPFLASTLDLQHLIESRVSKHPSVAEDPIHIVIDSKGKEDMPPWFEQQELRHSKDDSGEEVTITADIPSVLASSDGEYWGIAVCVIFECPSEGAWRGFAINWKFQDYPYTSEKKGGRLHRTHANAGTQVDSTDETIHSKKTADDGDPLAECRVYKGFFPIDREKCRQHPSGEGSQVNLTLCFPATNIGKVIIQSKETSFEDLEIVDGGWRLVCKKNLDASSERIRHETEIAENILGDELPSNFEYFVGDTQSKVDRIISHSKMGLEDTCFIGIWGERGIGKTTLARLVYDEIRSKFDATCFLDNIREVSERVGIVSLQKKLLSGLRLGERDIDNSFEGAKIIRKFLCHKKVLIILDDVNQKSQLENLAGNKEWFGAGSNIVITTRDKKLLEMYEQFEEYGVGRLHPNESLKLLCQEAFKKDEPQEGYWDLSQEVIKQVCRLPLVLKVLGSYLCKKGKNEWIKASERLRELRQSSPTDISSQLRISYDGLENEEYKRIFLDISCFFNWEPKFEVTNMLELCGHHGTNGVEVLIEKSLLNVTRSNSDLWQNAKEDQDVLGRIQKLRREIFLPTYLYDWLLQEASKEYLYMHDLLQVMGRNIVFQESNAGGRSRLWSAGEINDVLEGNKGDGSVESIVLHIQKSFEADWHPDCFSNMKELRLLDLSKVRLSRNLNFLPSALKIMRWDYYALESLPPVGQLHELESLRLCKSKIRKLWNGAPALDKLRIIDLSDSKCLEDPDFSGTPNLEELSLNRCRKLVQVHESVGQLKKLVKLNLQECRRLQSLPTLETDKLEELILSGCLKLEKLPEFGRNMGNLYFLDVRGTDITEIPLSIIHLSNLKCLDLTFCSRLKSIPKLPPNLIISASNCRLLEPTSALPHLYASCAPKGPIHLFSDFQLWTRIPTWFEQWEYCWRKDTDGPTSGEFVTITADIPSNVVADSNEEHWGIAVCVVFQFLSKAWLGFSVNWKFEDKRHPKNTKIHGTPAYYMHDCRVYMGFYPFEAKDCRQHTSEEGRQLDLTLEFPATNIIKGLHDLEIMGCGWRLACKKDFDEWSENRAPSPLRLDFLNRDRVESRDNTITEGKRKRKHRFVK